MRCLKPFDISILYCVSILRLGILLRDLGLGRQPTSCLPFRRSIRAPGPNSHYIVHQIWINQFKIPLILPDELKHRGNGVLTSSNLDLVLSSRSPILARAQSLKILMHLLLQESFEALKLRVFKYLLMKQRLPCVHRWILVLFSGWLWPPGLAWPRRRERLGLLCLELSVQVKIVVQHSLLLFLLWLQNLKHSKVFTDLML